MDVDLDFPTNFDPKTIFDEAIPASMVKKGELTKHPCGHYFQTIPVDEETNLAAIPYEQAEELGYFKIDFLHLSVLDHFESKDEIRALLKIEPDWSLLLDREQVSKLFQIHRHYDLLQKVEPASIQELADCIALIRPAKKHLIDDYINDRDGVRATSLYSKDDEGYNFKRSHAIAYAMTIVLQLHLIELGFI
jgi:Bacterial DNA polymerase III alpha subunit finger domain